MNIISGESPTHYFMFWSSEDGDCSAYGPLTREQVLAKIAPEGNCAPAEFLDRIPDGDIQCWPPYRWLIIRGQVIIPKPVEVVKAFDL